MTKKVDHNSKDYAAGAGSSAGGIAGAALLSHIAKGAKPLPKFVAGTAGAIVGSNLGEAAMAKLHDLENKRGHYKKANKYLDKIKAI